MLFLLAVFFAGHERRGCALQPARAVQPRRGMGSFRQRGVCRIVERCSSEADSSGRFLKQVAQLMSLRL